MRFASNSTRNENPSLAIPPGIRIPELEMHAAATFGRLRHNAPLQQGLHHNGECCTSSASGVRIRSQGGGRRSAGALAARGRDWRAAGRRGEGEQRFPVGEYGERIVVSSYDDDGGDAGDEIKLECDESGCVVVKTTSKTLEEEDDRTGFLCCDLTGCYFTDEPLAEKTFEVLEGEGWRLGYETAPDSEESFCAIVGAGGWSLALTASEFNDFCYLIQTLRKGISTMDEDGFIGKDEVVMQVERGSLWMECSIPKKRVAIFQDFWRLGNRALVDSQQKTAFKLRFLLSGASGRRQAEGFWPPEAVMDMLKKIDAINLEQEELANAQKPAAANA
ncbi:hypothetical protein M758_7G062100 [Ceratodon purpureus]|nr:hypothetical protein M758_7G062100 [Ceratodon purpureus]